MKKTGYFLLLLFPFTGNIFAQQDLPVLSEDEIPSAAQATLKKMYPTAVVENWYEEGADFEVYYKIGGKEFESIFNAEGKWIETESWLKISDLPKAVKYDIDRGDLGDWKIVSIEKLSLPDDPEFYEIDIKKGDELSQVYYDQDGTQLADDRWIDEDLDDFAELDEE